MPTVKSPWERANSIVFFTSSRKPPSMYSRAVKNGRSLASDTVVTGSGGLYGMNNPPPLTSKTPSAFPEPISNWTSLPSVSLTVLLRNHSLLDPMVKRTASVRYRNAAFSMHSGLRWGFMSASLKRRPLA